MAHTLHACLCPDLSLVELCKHLCSHKFASCCRHVMHANLTHLSEPSSALQGMTEQAAFFLLSTCIRSAEGRRRIVHEIVYTLNASDKADAVKETQNIRPLVSNPYRAQPGFAAPHKVQTPSWPSHLSLILVYALLWGFDQSACRHTTQYMALHASTSNCRRLGHMVRLLVK